MKCIIWDHLSKHDEINQRVHLQSEHLHLDDNTSLVHGKRFEFIGLINLLKLFFNNSSFPQLSLPQGADRRQFRLHRHWYSVIFVLWYSSCDCTVSNMRQCYKRLSTHGLCLQPLSLLIHYFLLTIQGVQCTGEYIRSSSVKGKKHFGTFSSTVFSVSQHEHNSISIFVFYLGYNIFFNTSILRKYFSNWAIDVKFSLPICCQHMSSSSSARLVLQAASALVLF